MEERKERSSACISWRPGGVPSVSQPKPSWVPCDGQGCTRSVAVDEQTMRVKKMKGKVLCWRCGDTNAARARRSKGAAKRRAGVKGGKR